MPKVPCQFLCSYFQNYYHKKGLVKKRLIKYSKPRLCTCYTLMLASPSLYCEWGFDIFLVLKAYSLRVFTHQKHELSKKSHLNTPVHSDTNFMHFSKLIFRELNNSLGWFWALSVSGKERSNESSSKIKGSLISKVRQTSETHSLFNSDIFCSCVRGHGAKEWPKTLWN